MGDTLIWLAEHIASISSLKKWMSPYPMRTEKGSHNVKWPSQGPEKEKSKSVNSLIQTLMSPQLKPEDYLFPSFPLSPRGIHQH